MLIIKEFDYILHWPSINGKLWNTYEIEKQIKKVEGGLNYPSILKDPSKFEKFYWKILDSKFDLDKKD